MSTTLETAPTAATAAASATCAPKSSPEAAVGVHPRRATAAFPDCPARLSAEQVAQFERDGYLAFENFLTPIEVAALTAGMSRMVATIAGAVRAGQGTMQPGNWMGMKNYSGLRMSTPGSKADLLFEPGVSFDLAQVTDAELETWVRKFSFPTEGDPAWGMLAQHPRLLPLIEGLLGPGPILFGDMALCKPARIGVAKPWHQDHAYFCYEPIGAGVDVWIALEDATVENGCMQVLPGGHRLGPKKHVHRDDCEIEAGRMDISRAVPAELKAGGVLLFSVMLPHFTPPNTSSYSRRSGQLFYRGANTRLVSNEEHGNAFREADGTPASCHGIDVKPEKSGKSEG
ncbi:MAG: phytanoyl-CoA dioxygenase family protein [Planctomycetota bacterium]